VTIAELNARRDYLREYLDHGVHNVAARQRRTLVDLLSASFVAQVRGDLKLAASKLAEVDRAIKAA
jgi:hypothetical protein